MSIPTSPHSDNPLIATSHLCPCTQARQSPPSPVPAEWVPLDSLVQDVAAFAAQASSALALLAAGQAFFALSHEVSAHQHYTLSVGTLFPGQRERVDEGLEQAVNDLEEAAQRWEGIVYLLDRVASEHDTSHDLVERIRPLVEGAYQQASRLSRLKADIFAEWALQRQHDAFPAASSPVSNREEA